ncbi:MAG: hypothetical protein ABIR19_05845, partial [Ginsengibacter sp.]
KYENFIGSINIQNPVSRFVYLLKGKNDLHLITFNEIKRSLLILPLLPVCSQNSVLIISLVILVIFWRR